MPHRKPAADRPVPDASAARIRYLRGTGRRWENAPLRAGANIITVEM
jgi:hypothetical protein